MHKSKHALITFICTAMSGMGTLALVCMTIFSTFLLMKNYVVEEASFTDNILDEHVFEMGMMDNIKMVMGMQVWKWPIPERNIQRDWNGIDFPMKPEK
jgi:hypothetical protein